MPPISLPKLTVPRTYMSACGVQSEITTKTLAKVARHEAAYRIEVDRHRQNLENQIKSIKREQQFFRNRAENFEAKLKQETALDSDGKVKPAVLKRKISQRMENNAPSKINLMERELRRKQKCERKMDTFFERVENKVKRDENEVSGQTSESFDFLEEEDKLSLSFRSNRRSRNVVRFSLHRIDSPMSPHDAGLFLDVTDSESDEDENWHKKDGGVPKIDVRNANQSLHGLKSPDDQRKIKISKGGRKVKKKKGPLSAEEKKQEHEVTVQQVTKRYVQFLARNAEANREKAAAEEQAAKKVGQSVLDLSLLHSTTIPLVPGQSPRLHGSRENSKGSINDSDREEIITNQRKTFRSNKALNKQSSFLQLVRLQQTTGISRNLQLIDKLLHRKKRERVGSLPKVIEESEEKENSDQQLIVISPKKVEREALQPGVPDTSSVQNTPNAGPNSNKGNRQLLKTNNSGQSTALTRNKNGNKRVGGHEVDDYYQGGYEYNPHHATFGFPQRLVHSRRWNNTYFASPQADTELEIPNFVSTRQPLPKIERSAEDGMRSEMPSMGIHDPRRPQQPQSRLHPIESAKGRGGPQPVWVSSLKVTGQGMLYPDTVLDEYIDKKLRRERMNSALRHQALIWREALAQVRKVHYLSYLDHYTSARFSEY